MKSDTEYPKWENIFKLVRHYGEILGRLRDLLRRQSKISSMDMYSASEVRDLLYFRERKVCLQLALERIADELEEEHGFSLEELMSWGIVGEHHFHGEGRSWQRRDL